MYQANKTSKGAGKKCRYTRIVVFKAAVHWIRFRKNQLTDVTQNRSKRISGDKVMSERRTWTDDVCNPVKLVMI